MRVVVFHRAPRPQSVRDGAISSPNFFGLSPYNPYQAISAVRKALLEPFSDRQFNLSLQENKLSIRFWFKFYGKQEEELFEVPLVPLTYYSFWYRSGLQRVDVVNEDFNRQNAMVAGLQHELADLAGAVGRILITDDEALLYLRGNLPDIAGFENVTVGRGEHSTWAFSRYSAKANVFLNEIIQRRRDETQTYSLPDKVSELENEIKLLREEIKQFKERN